VEAAAARDRRRQHGSRHHEIDYLGQAYWHGFTFRLGALIGIDRGQRLVRVAPYYDAEGRQVTPAREFGYDTLVIAIGSLTNDFATRGVKTHAIALETADEADRFHMRLVNACMRAHSQAEPLRPEQLQVAIIGAGATGTELAAELHKTTRQLVALRPRPHRPRQGHQDPSDRGGPRILPALPERLSGRRGQAAGAAQREHPHQRACHRGRGQWRHAGERHVHPGRARRVGRRHQGAGSP
jgi:NADH dehydrogenase